MQRHFFRLGCIAMALGLLFSTSTDTRADSASFLDTLATTPSLTASTVSNAGDQNPYGVAVVPDVFPEGALIHPGDILVSDFNDSTNVQGTGRSIVAITPEGSVSTFFTAPESLGPVGLTTALVALRSGLVIVGNTPNLGGTPPVVGNGSLIFLDGSGSILLNLSDSALLKGPWDMTADESDPDEPILYVSNVLSGTVTRIDLDVTTDECRPSLKIQSLTQVASGFAHFPSDVALVVGPTGVLLSHNKRDLYVADTGNNRVQFVEGVRGARRDRGAGETVVSGSPLAGPLGLAWTPRNTIVASNGDAVDEDGTPPNLVVEFNPRQGTFLATRQLDTSGTPGGLFGIAIARVADKKSLLYVDDNDNTLNVLPRQ